MPPYLRTSVQSLQHVCLQNVAKNMESLWAKNYKNEYFAQGNFTYLVGPFEDICKYTLIAINELVPVGVMLSIKGGLRELVTIRQVFSP